MLGTYVLPYLSSVLDGTIPHTLSPPLIPGANSIATQYVFLGRIQTPPFSISKI
jgi:hypothetical protein